MRVSKYQIGHMRRKVAITPLMVNKNHLCSLFWVNRTVNIIEAISRKMPNHSTTTKKILIQNVTSIYSRTAGVNPAVFVVSLIVPGDNKNRLYHLPPYHILIAAK